MERATDPQLIEEAEHILQEYCEELKLESISIFRKDGKLIYSSDPFMEQQEDVEELFQVLEVYVSDFIMGVPYFLLVYDSSICLILKPIYMGDWGTTEGWFLALGSSSEIRCEEISESLISFMAKARKADISENPEYHQRLETLQLAFDLPQILGLQFEKNENTTVLLDSDSGLIYQSYGGVPMVTTLPTYRDRPNLLRRLFDLHDYICYENWRILEPEIEPTKKKYSIKSDDLAKYFILYSLILCILLYPIAPFILFILFITFVPLRGGGLSYVIVMSIGGVLTLVWGLVSFFETLVFGSLIILAIGIQFLLSAIIVVRRGNVN